MRPARAAIAVHEAPEPLGWRLPRQPQRVLPDGVPAGRLSRHRDHARFRVPHETGNTGTPVGLSRSCTDKTAEAAAAMIEPGRVTGSQQAPAASNPCRVAFGPARVLIPAGAGATERPGFEPGVRV